MLLQATQSLLRQTITGFVTDLLGILPRLISAFLFLVIAVAFMKLLMTMVRTSLKRGMPGEAPVYRQFIATIISGLLWFGVLLGVLSILGLSEVAAALGTASGFVALGVAYALSGMIADAVAGVYLLRDPDFMPGDRVTVGDMDGVVGTIELRKTRFSVDGDTVVRGNAEIEKRWTKRAGE